MAKTSVLAKTTTEVKLKPTVRKKLLTELRTYAGLRDQKKAIDHAMTARRATVEEILEEVGETSLSLEGFTTTLVSPVKSRLDKGKLLAQGVTMAQIEAATITTPGKSYVKITPPGDKDSDDE